MASSRGVRDARSRPDAPLMRSNSDQLLLRKRQDFHYLDRPAAAPGPSARDRKAMADAAETAMLEQQQFQYEHQQQRTRAATAVLSNRGNDQGAGVGGGPFRLNRKEKLFLIKRAKESAVSLIEHAHTLDGPIQWHYKGKHRGIQMYRGEGMVENGGTGVAGMAGMAGMAGGVPGTTTTPVLGGEASSLEFLCGVTTMMGTLEEVSEYFDQATTARMRVKKAEDVLDCAVLYSLVWGNTVNPFHRVSVKYHAYEGPAAMTRPRDFCYLECQDTFRHTSGRRGWVLSMHSIKIPSCPEVPGFVRGSVYHSGFVFVEAERPGYMDVMYSLQINFKGHGRVPQFMLNAALKRRLRELIHISREIQVARMAHRTLLQDKDLMPKHLRSTCVICSRRFWLFLRKTRCRVCGEVVCQSCAPLVDWESAGSNGQHAKTRICVNCYSTAPTTGSWTAPSEGLPWTEQSHFEHNSSVPMLSPKRTMRRVKEGRQQHDEDDEDDEEDDGEGRYTFAELEEQSSHSVFAPERFTRSSMASIAPLQIDEIGVDYDGVDHHHHHHHHDDDDASSVRSSDKYWQRGTEESVFHIGSLNSSIMSRDSYFGRPDPAPPVTSAASRYSTRHQALSSVPDDTPILMEEPEPNQVSHVNARVSKKYQSAAETTAAPTTASSTATDQLDQDHKEQLQQRHTTSPGGSKSSFEFLDGLIDLPLTKRTTGGNDPSRPRAQTTIQPNKKAGHQLNPSTLRAHNLRYLRGFEHETPASSRVSFANRPQNTPPTPDASNSHMPRASNEPVVLDDLLPSTSLSSNATSFDGNATSTSVSTNSLFSRPSTLILQQVRKNRSRTIQLQTQSEDEFRSTKDIEDKAKDHRRRMQELNEKALAYTGNRVSTLENTRPSLEPEKVDDEVWRSSALMEEYRSRRKHTIEALRKKALSIQDDNRESSGTDHTAASSPSFVGVQRIGEAAMSRSPSLSGPLSEIKTRGIYGRSSSTERQQAWQHASQSTDPSHASPLPLPPMLTRTTSDKSTTSNHSSPHFGRKHLVSKPSESSMRGLSEDLTFKPSLDLPAAEAKLSVAEEDDEDEDLQLSSSDDSKRSSRATHDEEAEPEQELELEIQASRGLRKAPPPPREFVTPRSLYAEIGLLTQLHSEAASTEDTNEVDRIKERIQEQYQLIRTLQLK